MMDNKKPTPNQLKLLKKILNAIGKASAIDSMNALYMAMQVVDSSANGIRTRK